jgi:dTDP-L-rhamnose 4-epimerase
VYNVGSGHASTVLELEATLRRALGRDHVLPDITGRYRVGDVRHCFADIGAARTALGYEPAVSLAEGLAGFVAWFEGQVASDHTAEALAELDARGLAL